MAYFIGAVTIIVCFVLANITLDQGRFEESKLLRSKVLDGHFPKKQLNQQQIRFFSMLILVAVTVTMWRLSVTGHEILNITKLSIALVCLTGSACADYIEHRIPNIFPLILSLGAILFLTIGCVINQDGAIAYVVSSVFACVITTVCLDLGALLSHHGIGMGDIKLVASLALMGGVYITGGTLFFAIILCGFVSLFLLITKKKKVKESIPFGPFILIGYMLSICATIF